MDPQCQLCPQSWQEPGGGQAEGELLPEAVLVALAQVAGAAVLAGVLDAGVDGRGTVFALWGRGRSTQLGRLSGAVLNQETPGSSQHPLGWGLQCDKRRPQGAPAAGGSLVRRGGMWRIQESGSPEFTWFSLSYSKPQGKCMGFGYRTTWIHIAASSLLGWLTLTL